MRATNMEHALEVLSVLRNQETIPSGSQVMKVVSCG